MTTQVPVNAMTVVDQLFQLDVTTVDGYIETLKQSLTKMHQELEFLTQFRAFLQGRTSVSMPKRPRGRPAKHSNEALENELFGAQPEDTTPPSPTLENELFGAQPEDITPQPKRSYQRRSKAAADGDTIAPKRPRGRPPKPTTTSCADIPYCQTPADTRSPRRKVIDYLARRGSATTAEIAEETRQSIDTVQSVFNAYPDLFRESVVSGRWELLLQGCLAEKRKEQ